MSRDLTLVLLLLLMPISGENAQNDKPIYDFKFAAAMAEHFRMGDIVVLSDFEMLSQANWRRELWEFQRGTSIPSSSVLAPYEARVNVSNAALVLAVLSDEGSLGDLIIPRKKGNVDSALLLHLPKGDTNSTEAWLAHAKSILSPLDIRYDSQLFVIKSDNDALTAWEVYRGIGATKLEQESLIMEPFAIWDRHEEALKILAEGNTWQRRANLQGRLFRLTVRENMPFITKTVDGCSSSLQNPSDPPCMEGMFAEVFLELQKVMNFSFELKVPPDQQYGGRQADGSWNGMIGMIVNGQADLSASDFTLSKERSTAIDFLTPLTETHLRLIIANPSDSTNWLAYIRPLTWHAWALVLVLAAVVPLVLAGAVIMANDRARSRFALPDCLLFFSTVTFLNRGWIAEPESNSARVVFLSGLLAGVVVYYHWEASIISFLAVRTITLPFESLQDLLDNTDTKIILQSGTAFVDTFRYSKDSLFQRVWSERMEPVQDQFSTSKTVMGETVANSGGSLAMMDNFQARQFRQDYISCRLIDVPRPYVPDKNAFIIKKDSPYRESFVFHLRLMDERGATGKIMAQYSPPPQGCPEYSGRPLGSSQCLFAFVALAAGGAAAMIAFMLEAGYYWTGSKLISKHSAARVGAERNRELAYHLSLEKYHAKKIGEIRKRIRSQF